MDPEQLRLFWFFAMPGIIILYFRAQFLTGRLPVVAEALIAYMVVSIAYHALLFPFARSLYSTPVDTVWQGLVWFAYILIGPAVTGILLGLSVQKGWGRWLLEKCKLKTVHSIASAWDWRFANCADCFVMVVMKDGIKWAGYLGKQSFISSIPTERDIFLEKVYTIEDDNSWTARVSGVWLAHGEIQSIEFWPNDKDKK